MTLLLARCSHGLFSKAERGETSFALPVSESGTPFDDLVAPLAKERPDQSGLMLLDGNLDAFAIRAATARRAQRSLDLQYYIWQADLTGLLLANEVIKAADRGVRVRLLLDDINAWGRDRAHLALDGHPNIAVRLFNPSRNREGVIGRLVEMVLRSFSITRRMHNKAWIADGRMAVVGGRNVGDAYFDAAQESNFRDLDVLLLGAAVRQTEVIFDDFWNGDAALPIAALRKPRGDDLPSLREKLSAFLSGERTKPYLERVIQNESVRDMLSGKGALHWTADAKIISDPAEKAGGKGQKNWLGNAVLPLLTSARSGLEIISPYFIPGEAGTKTLIRMAGKGVKVSILTNSLAATDVTAVHGAYARYRKPLVEAGIDLFELKAYDAHSGTSLFGSSSASLHTKAFTVDDRLGFVGSMNFDPRSLSLNTEMGVFFEHRGLVAEIREVFADETSPEKSYRIRIANGETAWEDHVAGHVRLLEEEPKTGLLRRLAATIIGLLPIESQL